MKQHDEISYCPHGHPYTEENLLITSRGWKKCRQCNRDQAAKRWKRDHPISLRSGPPRLTTPQARRMVYNPKHPLATKGYVLESRMVLYDSIGPGSHLCHWCNASVQWLPGSGPRKGALIADHLDNNKHHNDPLNLVPSCQPCNGTRNLDLVQDHEVFILRKNGTRVRAEERACEQCNKIFLIPPAATTRGRGRFCSLSCARRKPSGQA